MKFIKVGNEIFVKVDDIVDYLHNSARYGNTVNSVVMDLIEKKYESFHEKENSNG